MLKGGHAPKEIAHACIPITRAITDTGENMKLVYGFISNFAKEQVVKVAPTPLKKFYSPIRLIQG